MERNELQSLQELKQEEKIKILDRANNGILEKENADFLIKLIDNAENKTEVLKISALGMTYKRTGFHFDVRLEKNEGQTIRYLKKNENLSFDQGGITHKLIIGDNYPALLNLLINYKNKIKVIYIDPPYGKDDLGEFAQTNYNNAITRDNLLSMLYPRLILARQLLKDDGVIFCSIDDRNQAYIKCLFDEVFGEGNFIFSAPRIIKKGGKSTNTIAKNHEYIVSYAKNLYLMDNFSLDERNTDKFILEDEYIEERGKYALTQTLDYSSLQYSKNMDYPIEINGKIFYAGSDYEKYLERQNGKHGNTDWVWRWSKSAVEWGIENGFIVIKNNRIYTKSYEKCRKKNGKNEIEYIEGKSYTTLSFLENENSNDNGKKELDLLLSKDNSNAPFKNPKPSALIINLLKMVSFGNTENNNDIILDFFAGSGTTGHAVLELNKQDGGNRQFILVTNNEITDLNPNGIALDVTSKRLKRIMSGECYDQTREFKWLEKNTPYGDSLEVSEIQSIASSDHSVFEKIDEKLYGKDFENIHDKIEWICKEFELTCRKIEGE
ncbi:site-specific DNA-methyltransferase [Campylobacter coli]|nr:site-specific DNA-methyltransferase [Campylobacter coli]EDO6595393.1 site-specific DNA-methyltransferase [Campylobacter coli]EDO8877504.1 site-specific DNA-methyltransferase [Campylobacter coli]